MPLFTEMMEMTLLPVNQPSQVTVNTVQNKTLDAKINLVNQYANQPLIKANAVVENLFNARDLITNNPSISITPPQFGVLGHIDPTRVFLLDAIQSINNLREQLTGSGSIADKAVKLFVEIKAKNDSENLDINYEEIDKEYWEKYNLTPKPIFAIDYEISDKFDATIYFAPGADNFGDEYKENLAAHVDFLKSGTQTVTLEGYAYASSSASTNLSMSTHHATVVENFLVSKGIASTRVTKIGRGSQGEDKQDRVVIIFSGGVENNLKKIVKRVGVKTISDLDKDFAKSAAVYSTALFSTANNFKKDIREVDQLHNQLMIVQNQLSHALTRKKNELTKLDAEIPVLQRNLTNLNQQRIKAYGEYQMVMALVAEDWLRVEQEYARRERILTNHSGLYFVRVRETPFSRTSVVDRSLRYGRIEDLVPATAISQDELPEDIEDYIETIVDIPIANWKLFNESWNSLPSRNTIIKLMEQRKLRLTYLSQKTRKASSSKFVPMLQVHQAILQDYARFEFLREASLQAFYRQAVQVISLEDLLTGTPHQLRSKAQNFRNQLDQATHALLAKLQNIKPSIRLEWATAAELDQLDLRNPHLWPSLQSEQQEDIGNIRSLFELINWWWRQLNEDASSASVTAVRNLLRAALMVSVGDDPQEMIHGYLQVVPAQFRSGDFLRAKLNRHAPIGTFLQLVNEKNELIGKLRVEDADENGSVVSVTQMLRQEIIQTTSQFSVIGIKTTGRSFV